MDKLIQYVLDEIAMDGPSGTNLHRLSTFITDFYLRSHPSSSFTRPQATDNSFFNFAWSTLVQQDELIVAHLVSPPLPAVMEITEEELAGEQFQQESELGSEHDGSQQTEDEEKGTSFKKKQKSKVNERPPKARSKAKEVTKGRQKAKTNLPPAPTLETVPRDLCEELGLEGLRERFGEKLRVMVSAEGCWVAITGSYSKPPSITQKVYEVLQLVSRTRGEGATVVDVGKELAIDQKSAFHYVQSAVSAGLIKKFRDNTAGQGLWTNRLIHVRHLSISASWAAHSATDPDLGGVEEANPAEETAKKEENLDEWGYGAGGDAGLAVELGSLIPCSMMWSNVGFLRKRIVRCLKEAREKGVEHFPHVEMARSIGLIFAGKQEQRRFNAILTSMHEDKVIEKVLVQYEGSLGKVVAAHCLRLPDSDENEGNQGDSTSNTTAHHDELNPDSVPRASSTVSIERQVVDFLAQADTEGVIVAEIANALGGIHFRAIDAFLNRAAKNKQPPHLADFTIHSVTETFGREKRTRYFLLPAYRRRCEKDGLVDPSIELGPDAKADLERTAGGWGSIEEEFYENPTELEEILGTVPLKTSEGGVRGNGKRGRGKGKKKQRETVDGVEGDGSDGAVKRRRGRKAGSVKVRVPGGPMTYYEKRKLEDAERKRLGLPPREKRPTSGGGRRPKGWVAPEGEEKKPPKKKAKRNEAAAPAQDQPKNTVSEDDSSSSDSEAGDAAETYRPRPSTSRPRSASLPPSPAAMNVTDHRPTSTEIAIPPLRRRGRPPKPKAVLPTETVPEQHDAEPSSGEPLSSAREYGSTTSAGNDLNSASDNSPALPKRRGRPPKVKPTAFKLPDSSIATSARGLGTPTPNDQVVTAIPDVHVALETSSSALKRRGRPPNVKPAVDTAKDSLIESAPPVATAPSMELSPAPRRGRSQSPNGGPSDVVTHPRALKSTAGAEFAQEAPLPAPRRRGRSSAVNIDSQSLHSQPPNSNQTVAMLSIHDDIETVSRTLRKRGPPSSENQNERKAVEGSEVDVMAVDELESLEQRRENQAPGLPDSSSAPYSPRKTRLSKAVPTSQTSTSSIVGPFTVASTSQLTPRRNPVTAEGQRILPRRDFSVEIQVPSAKRRKVDHSATTPTQHPSSINGSRSPQNHTPVIVPPTRGPSVVGKVSTKKVVAAPEQRASFSSLQRQADLLAFVEHCGGVAEAGVSLSRQMNLFSMNTLKSSRPFTEDKITRNQTIDALVNRGALKKTIIQHGGRREIIYLPHISIESAEFRAFVGKLAGPSRQTSTTNRKLRLEELTANDLQRNPPPHHTSSYETIEEYFRRDSKVLGAKYGVFHGRYARAREMHRFMVGVAETNPSGSDVVVTKGEGYPTVISTDAITYNLPLSTLLRVIPLPESSADFDAFLANPVNKALAMRDLPQWVLQLVSPSLLTRKRSIANVLFTLTELGVVRPLITRPSAPGESRQTFEIAPSRRISSASHWLLCSEAPVYSLADPIHSLVATPRLTTTAEVEAYWRALKSACLQPAAQLGLDTRPTISSSRWPELYEGSTNVGKNLVSMAKWREEYALQPNQRTFLAQLVLDINFNSMDAGRIQDIAGAILAPPVSVLHYLQHLDFLKSRGLRRDGSNNRIQPDDGGSMAPAGDELPPGFDLPEAPLSFAAQLRLKAQDVASQRQRDWTSLLDRFKSLHSDFEPHPRIVEYLRKRFCSPLPSRQIDSKTAERELSLLLPIPSASESDFRSIIPTSILRAIITEKDPYTLPSGAPPTIKRRQHKALKGNALAPTTSSNHDEEDDTDQEKGDEEFKLAFSHSGNANEFFSSPFVPPAPIAKGQRLPRNYFNDEHLDVIIDGAAILKSRSERLGVRMQFGALEQLFDGKVSRDKLRSAWLQVQKKPEQATYFDRLKDAFSKIWEAKQETSELPDTVPESMTDVDLPAFVRCLRANVNKNALRMAGPKSVPELPTITELPPYDRLRQAAYLSEADRSQQWDQLWKFNVTSFLRENLCITHPFSLPCWTETTGLLDQSQSLTEAAIKMLLSTPADSYDEEEGTAFMSPFAESLEPAVNNLMSSGIIHKVHSEAARRIPGRNFVFNDKYLASFEGHLSSRKIAEARRADTALRTTDDPDSEELWPMISQSGEMMALIELFSDGKLDITVDVASSSELRPADDYQTRQSNDESIECGVQVGRAPTLSSSLKRPVIFQPLLSSSKVSSDAKRLSASLTRVTKKFDSPDDVQSTLSAIVKAGLAGVTLSGLKSYLPEIDVDTVVKALLHSNPALAFWAGHSAPVLVSSQFINMWTVHLKDGKRVFPAIWLGVDGGTVSELWDKALHFVQDTLLGHPGFTCASIAQQGNQLSLYEVMTVLRSMAAVGAAYSISTAGMLDGKAGEYYAVKLDNIDWETSRWFLGERWYR
ncbi:hypothetical protein T439DRAFT_82046 [Meredithblackwellia eburnea MCA 4105]